MGSNPLDETEALLTLIAVSTKLYSFLIFTLDRKYSFVFTLILIDILFFAISLPAEVIWNIVQWIFVNKLHQQKW